MKRFIYRVLLVLMLLYPLKGHAQHSWGVHVGTVTGGSYLFHINRAWAIELHAGFEINNLLAIDQGMSPTVSMFAKYNFFKDRRSPYYREGGYVGINFLSRFHKLRLWGDETPKGIYTYPHLTAGFVTTLGWNFPLTERSYIYTSLGLGYLYHTYWDEYLNRNATALGSAPPLLLNLGYSLRF